MHFFSYILSTYSFSHMQIWFVETGNLQTESGFFLNNSKCCGIRLPLEAEHATN